jgi:hypothetical protein
MYYVCEWKYGVKEEQRSKEADHQASVDVRPRLRFHRFGGVWANLIRNDTGVSKGGSSNDAACRNASQDAEWEVGCAFR